MNMSKRLILGLVSSLAFTSITLAQGVAVPAIPATPAAPANLWSFLCLTPEQKANCKNCFCNSALGKMVSSATAPMSAMTGGLIQNRCLKNSIENAIANKPPTSSEGAAARIKKDEEEAKARREAIRFLGTVDCNYWPEATEALILGLRKDPNECVRFEAALSLRNGCCCNEKTIKALEMSVSGSDKDGAPAERSDRVRAAAADALARCPLIQKEIEEKQNEDIKKTERIDPREYYRKLAQVPREQVVSSARGLLVSLQNVNNTANTGAVAAPSQRSGSLSAIVANAFGNTQASPVVITARAQTKPLSLYELITTRNSSTEYITPTRTVQQDVIVPAQPEYGVPANVPTPRASNPVVIQGGLRAPLPTGPQTPMRTGETTGFVTVETVPPTPLDVRMGRP